jgi:anthranilate phosphoribosyltransferase
MMVSLRDILLKLSRREDLSRQEARDAFALIMSGQASDAQIGGLLVGLAAKGSTVDELAGAAIVLREQALHIPIANSGVILDTCGTGGDVRGTFNISTAAALITAAAGVPVVKHGNRSASGRSGSADVLEKLGVQLQADPHRLARCLAEANICFAFARNHHPAMKFVAAARTALGIPTIFNLLGPLTNPARARHQLLGVFAPELTERLAYVLRELGSERAWVVCAQDGMDELSTILPTRVSELRDGTVKSWTLDPRSLGLAVPRFEDLQAADVAESARMILAILHGEKGPPRDIALLNAAGALVVAGRATDMPAGLRLAQTAVDDGAAAKTLEALVRHSG